MFNPPPKARQTRQSLIRPSLRQRVEHMLVPSNMIARNTNRPDDAEWIPGHARQ